MNSAAHEEKYRLIVVDDNRAIHDDFRKILLPNSALSVLEDMEAELFGDKIKVKQRQYFELDSAYQGKEGFEMVKNAVNHGRPYSLAFVDMRMPPGWDGIETIERIWEVDPELQVVICSAYSDHSWSEIAQRLGNSDRLLILKKPFDNVEITQMAHAMSQKCILNRLAKNLQPKSTGPADTSTSTLKTADTSRPQLEKLAKFIEIIDTQVLLPIHDIKESVESLNRSFAKLSLTLKKMHEVLSEKQNLHEESLVSELQAAVNENDLSHLQNEIPEVFSRLQSALESIDRNADDIRSLLNVDSPVH